MSILKILPLTALLALGGCYTYSAAPADAVSPGARIRARITAVEAERLGEVLGREERLLEGRVISHSGGNLLLEVPAAVTSEGTSVRWLNQRVELPPSAVLELESRRLDPWRTGAAVAVVATAVGYAAIQAFNAVGKPSSEGSKGGTDQFIGIALPFPW